MQYFLKPVVASIEVVSHHKATVLGWDRNSGACRASNPHSLLQGPIKFV